MAVYEFVFTADDVDIDDLREELRNALEDRGVFSVRGETVKVRARFEGTSSEMDRAAEDFAEDLVGQIEALSLVEFDVRGS